MQFISRSLAAAALALLCSVSFAQTSTYTSQSDFLTHVAPGAYTETFTGLAADPPTSFEGNGFSYTVSAASGVYSSGDSIGTNQPYETLTLSFSGSAVTALGGNFFSLDLSDNFVASTITLTLSDNTTVSFDSSSMDGSYFAFTTNGAAITSLSVTSEQLPMNGLYPNLANLTVGEVNAVPEPSSLLLVGAGLSGLLVRRRRQR